MFILNGTPNEIWEAVQSIETKNPKWDFKVDDEGWSSTSSINASSGKVDFDFIKVSSDDLLDCNGDFNGSAYIDDRETCVEGNTGKENCVAYDCMGVENGDAYLNNCGQCVGGTSPLSVFDSWKFSDVRSWTLNPRMTGYSNNGVAYLRVTGVDPFLTCNDVLCINTNEYKYLKAKAANFTVGTGLTIFSCFLIHGFRKLEGSWRNSPFQRHPVGCKWIYVGANGSLSQWKVLFDIPSLTRWKQRNEVRSSSKRCCRRPF